MADNEQDLKDLNVEVEKMVIIEITRYQENPGGEIQICDVEGILVGIREYAGDSPVDKVVELLAQLCITGLYGTS